jgi:hypothetical protein
MERYPDSKNPYHGRDQKNLRQSGAKVLLRGTTLLALLILGYPEKVKPLWTALTGGSRHQLICLNPTIEIAGPRFTDGVCHNWRSRRVRPYYVLQGHFAGLPPLSPSSLLDDLLLLP